MSKINGEPRVTAEEHLCPKCRATISSTAVGVMGYFKKIIERKCAMCGYIDYPDAQFKDHLVLVDFGKYPKLLETLKKQAEDCETSITEEIRIVVEDYFEAVRQLQGVV